jgi:hypothetical protein
MFQGLYLRSMKQLRYFAEPSAEQAWCNMKLLQSENEDYSPSCARGVDDAMLEDSDVSVGQFMNLPTTFRSSQETGNDLSFWVSKQDKSFKVYGNRYAGDITVTEIGNIVERCKIDVDCKEIVYVVPLYYLEQSAEPIGISLKLMPIITKTETPAPAILESMGFCTSIMFPVEFHWGRGGFLPSLLCTEHGVYLNSANISESYPTVISIPLNENQRQHPYDSSTDIDHVMRMAMRVECEFGFKWNSTGAISFVRRSDEANTKNASFDNGDPATWPNKLQNTTGSATKQRRTCLVDEVFQLKRDQWVTLCAMVKLDGTLLAWADGQLIHQSSVQQTTESNNDIHRQHVFASLEGVRFRVMPFENPLRSGTTARVQQQVTVRQSLVQRLQNRISSSTAIPGMISSVQKVTAEIEGSEKLNAANPHGHEAMGVSVLKAAVFIRNVSIKGNVVHV